MRSKYQEFSIKQGFVGTQTEPKLSPDSLIRGTQVEKWRITAHNFKKTRNCGFYGKLAALMQ
jgi:hypothetical protein